MLNGNHHKLGKLSTTKIKDFILSNINRSSNNGMLFSPNSTRTSSSIFGDPRIGFNVQESDIEIISIIPSIQSRLCGLSELPNNELAVSLNNEIIVINLTNNQQIKLSDHGDLVNDLKLSLKNNLLLSCSSDKSLKIWDLMKKTCINTLIGHKNPVTTCIISEFVIKSKQSPLITQKLKVGIEKSEYTDDSEEFE
jgi:WD40 repeat protein